jgi:hypothetical protein
VATSFDRLNSARASDEALVGPTYDESIVRLEALARLLGSAVRIPGSFR